jgi:hypothetical protein
MSKKFDSFVGRIERLAHERRSELLVKLLPSGRFESGRYVAQRHHPTCSHAISVDPACAGWVNLKLIAEGHGFLNLTQHLRGVSEREAAQLVAELLDVESWEGEADESFLQ